MKISLAILAALASILVPAAAGAGEQVNEKEYTLLAAKVVATVDACTALEIIEPQVGMLDEIEVAMLSFGAQPEEVEEWQSNVIARNSEGIQAALKAEDENAAWIACTKDIDEQRKKLAGILNGDDEDATGPAPDADPVPPSAAE
jgi:type II secretory pathway component PulM